MAFKHIHIYMPMYNNPEGVTVADCVKNKSKYLLKISEK